MVIILIRPTIPSCIKIKVYILCGFSVFGRLGELIWLTFALNSWEVIKENPIIGVGTGDFPIEYKKVNKRNTPELPNATNPHNMFTLIAVELGALGIISMLSIFYYQIKLSFNSSNRFIRDVGITLPLLFLVIMWSDSYLLGHYTTLMYVFFSSFLYKDFEKY